MDGMAGCIPRTVQYGTGLYLLHFTLFLLLLLLFDTSVCSDGFANDYLRTLNAVFPASINHPLPLTTTGSRVSDKQKAKYDDGIQSCHR